VMSKGGYCGYTGRSFSGGYQPSRNHVPVLEKIRKKDRVLTEEEIENYAQELINEQSGKEPEHHPPTGGSATGYDIDLLGGGHG
jgi:hypothetical protein